MKIAFYLGSFNPFHNGHLRVVKTALSDHSIDKVVIVPTMQNPWKEEKVLDIQKREEIVRKFYCYNIGLQEHVSTDLIEKELTPPYYSYNTLQALKERYSDSEQFFLCGEDTIRNIPNWYNGNRILEGWKFIVIDRPKDDISSTMIRELVRNHKDIAPYVSRKAEKLINDYYLCE